VKRDTNRDHRQYPRYPELVTVRARELQPLKSGISLGKPVVGRVQNVSQGGLCLMSRQPLVRSSVIRCDIGVSEIPVGIPTLMQVRWTQKLQSDSYVTGLQFLL
jgi:hypothetical protein